MKTNQLARPGLPVNVDLAKPAQHADKNCPICKGRGGYVVVHIGEYDEAPIFVKCACTNKTKKAKTKQETTP